MTIASLMLMLAAPAEAATPLPAPMRDGQQVTVRARFLPRGEQRRLAFEIVKGAILFRATIAGHDGWMLLDNGAERSLVDTGLANAAGLAIAPGRAGVTRLPGGGSLATGTVPDATLLLPGQVEVRAPLRSADLSGLARTYGRPIAGVFGGDFLGHLEVQIDPGSLTMVLRPSGTAVPPAGFSSVTLAGSPPRLTVTIDNKPVTLMLDLGVNATLVLTPAAWARVRPAGVATRPIVGRGGDGVVKVADAAVLPAVRLGSATRHDAKVGIMAWPIPAVDGALGFGALSTFSSCSTSASAGCGLHHASPAPPSRGRRRTQPAQKKGRRSTSAAPCLTSLSLGPRLGSR